MIQLSVARAETHCARVRLLIIVLFVVLCGANPVAAQEVTILESDVYFRPTSQASWRRVTNLGDVRTAVPSPGIHLIAFVRNTPGDSVETGMGKVVASELWVAGVDGSGARRLLHGRNATPSMRVLGDLANLVFSPDERQVFFTSAEAVTSLAVHAADIQSGTERFICPGTLKAVVPTGKYAGDIIVNQHRYFLLGGSYDWLWLITPNGKEVGPLGEAREDIDGIVAQLDAIPVSRRDTTGHHSQ